MENSRIVEVIDFNKYSKEIEHVRNEVFIKEQKIEKDLEWDGEDKNCFHVLIFVQNMKKECLCEEFAVGTGRVMKDGHIGRISVLKEYRGKGLGTTIMKVLEKIAKENTNSKHVFLGAQESALKFYEKIGYKIDGEMFMEANIPHYPMKKKI